jgi:hypothetical protein
MNRPQYFLSSHVFVCAVESHWIILDVSRDKYLCIHKRHFFQLGPQVHGWSGAFEPTDCDDEVSPDAIALTSDLLQQEILTQDPTRGKRTDAVKIPAPTAAFNSRRAGPSKALQLLYVPAFLLASARADYYLKRRSFEKVTYAVDARRHRRYERRRMVHAGSVESLLFIFNALRPIYPRDYLCLFDSLALIEFLAQYGLFPRWVFGVSADPFGAHCWVQDGGFVMNDTLERVFRYRPIMSV